MLHNKEQHSVKDDGLPDNELVDDMVKQMEGEVTSSEAPANTLQIEHDLKKEKNIKLINDLDISEIKDSEEAKELNSEDYICVRLRLSLFDFNQSQ